MNKNRLSKLKKRVSLLASDPNFIHHRWYIKYHLNYVEKLASELCSIYKEANSEIVLLLVWIHDLGKIARLSSNMKSISKKINEVLSEAGYDKQTILTVVKYYQIFESKMEIDLRTTPIEVQIASSADAASHLIGPFYPLYWYENHTVPFEQLMANNHEKALKDWNRKVVLPEVKLAFEKRHQYRLEIVGKLPRKFL